MKPISDRECSAARARVVAELLVQAITFVWRLPTHVCAWIGRRLGDYLSQSTHVHGTSAPIDPVRFMAALRPGDVLLVEGQARISVAIKYLTQSTWSHAAIYVGPLSGLIDATGRKCCFIEADIREGVRAVSVAEFTGLHCRICRPVGLDEAEISSVVAYVKARLGHQYDLKNVIDLARYLLPTTPVPVRWRRRMLAFGSGDPTRSICSTLIAQAFQSVGYPVLPIVETRPSKSQMCSGCVEEILHVRHHSLFVPRDFDVSPYFAIIKPSLSHGFDYRALVWHREAAEARRDSSQPEPV
jgi:hypothetical protein